MSNPNFYPGDLAAQIAEFLKGHRSPDDIPEVMGGVVPHAGWMYSGRVAARVWKTIADLAQPETVIILGAVHGPLVMNAVFPEGEWETPLGPVEVDRELAAEVVEEIPSLAVADAQAHQTEHSIEVEMPFLKVLLPRAKVVPIAVPPYRHPVQLGDRLGRLTKGRRVVAVASSDLTHYGERQYSYAPRGTGPAAHEWLKANDRRLLDLVEGLLAEEISPEVASHRNACGPDALAAAAAFARARGAERGLLLEHTTSHEVRAEGEFSFGVGYAGVIF